MLVSDGVTEFIRNMEADAIEDYEVERLLDIKI